MKKELADRFSDEVERHRRALLYCARKCDWEAFKAKAGSLFDYVERIEISEIENRFFRIFKSILVVLAAVAAAVMSMDVSIHPNLNQVRYSIIVLGIAGSCFEFYFFLGYKKFMEAKSTYYDERKDRFIKGMEKDFREMTMTRQCAA